MSKCPTCGRFVDNNDLQIMCSQCSKEFLLIPHINQIARVMDRAVRLGGEGFLKFTCLHCGSRQTIDRPNSIYTSGKCEECNGISDFRSPSVDLGVLFQSGTPVEVIDKIIMGE